MTTAIIFILVLSVLVFVHELGHFLFAKWTGMRVDEFGIGFPPKAFSWKRGETTYSVNFLLFGGFVKIHGEDQGAPLEGADRERSFGSRPRYWQALVLVAGVTFNVLFAWLLISIGFMFGFPVSTDFYEAKEFREVKVYITQVLPDTPASLSGLKAGDQIVGLRSIKDSIVPTYTKDVQDFIATHGFNPVEISFIRSDIASSTTVLPIIGTISEKPVIGVGLDSVGILSLPIHEAFWQGARLTALSVENTIRGLGGFIYKAFTEEHALSTITGPVGIATLVGDARQLGLAYFISFVSFISINLAVINLVPLPALDGGRLLMVLIEAIIRRPIPIRISHALNTGGFLLLLLLMAVVTYNDIIKLIF